MSSSRPNSRPTTSSLLPSALPQDQIIAHKHGASAASAPYAAVPSSASFPSPHHHDLSGASLGGTINSLSYPPFQPFFTLVEDRALQSTVHPSVSYLFTDDDQDALTAAAVRIDAELASSTPTTAGGAVATGNSKRRSLQVQASGATAPSEQQLDTATIEPIERYVLVTLGPDGRSVASAVSLTPNWFVEAAELNTAPTLEDGGGDYYLTAPTAAVHSPGTATAAAAVSHHMMRRGSTAGSRRSHDEAIGIGIPGGGGVGGTPPVPALSTAGAGAGGPVVEGGPLMLRIHGSGVPVSLGSEEAISIGIDGLCETFRERLSELRRVVQADEERGGTQVERQTEHLAD